MKIKILLSVLFFAITNCDSATIISNNKFKDSCDDKCILPEICSLEKTCAVTNCGYVLIYPDSIQKLYPQDKNLYLVVNQCVCNQVSSCGSELEKYCINSDISWSELTNTSSGMCAYSLCDTEITTCLYTEDL